MNKDTTGGKEKLVWAWMENQTATHSALHCYYSRERKRWGEKYEGNAALCNKKYGISEDGDSFLHINEIEPSALDRDRACKSCLKIFDKRPIIKPNNKDNG